MIIVLLTTCTIASVNVSATNAIAKNLVDEKHLTLELSQLTDNTGLVYFAAKVPKKELTQYLSQLKAILGEAEYARYRQHQSRRDHQSFHMTLINPYEYKTINQKKLNITKKINIKLHGLGKASKENNTTYFVVASSIEGKHIRDKLSLNNKDFHVTLGFYPEDVYGVRKSIDTLIKK